jgi:hypothetical protein
MNVEKVWDVRYTLGARYLSKNTVFVTGYLFLNIIIIYVYLCDLLLCLLTISVSIWIFEYMCV